MTSEPRLVHIVDDVPALAEREDPSALTMVVVLDGFLDAGNAAGRAAWPCRRSRRVPLQHTGQPRLGHRKQAVRLQPMKPVVATVMSCPTTPAIRRRAGP